MKSLIPKPLTSTPTCYSYAVQFTVKKPIFNNKFTANRDVHTFEIWNTIYQLNSNSIVRTAFWHCHKIHTSIHT